MKMIADQCRLVVGYYRFQRINYWRNLFSIEMRNAKFSEVGIRWKPIYHYKLGGCSQNRKGS